MANNLIYVGVVVIIILIVAGVVLLGSGSSSSQASTSTVAASTVAPASSQTTQPSTTIAPVSTVNPYNTTTTVVPSNITVSNSTTSGCTATTYYTCSNFTFSASKITATIGENTGLNWSSFGVGYAPQGTAISSGTPTDIAFYSANTSATNNVGTSLLSGSTANIQIPVSSTSTVGTLWVCYVNSGLVYVGSSGCIANGGGSAVPTYVEIATVNG